VKTTVVGHLAHAQICQHACVGEGSSAVHQCVAPKCIIKCFDYIQYYQNVQ